MRLFRSRKFVLSLPGILEVLGIDMYFVFRGQTAGLGSPNGAELAIGGPAAARGAQMKGPVSSKLGTASRCSC